jgi:hypothetical protein
VTEKIRIKTTWVRSTDCLAGLALFFISIFFFYDLFDGKYLLTERDLGPYFIPPRFFWIESIKHGNFPLWNPYQFSGHPFFANPQHGMLYPLNSLFFLFPFDLAFNAIIVLHFFLGGVFTYLFLKDLRVSSTGSLISGLIFMLSGYLLSVHSLLTILLSSVWTPLIMMFFRRAINGKGFKNEIITSILITISFLGGGIEIVYGNFLVLFIMVIFFPLPDDTLVGDKPRHYKFPFGVPISSFFCSVPIYWGRIRSLFMVSILFLFLSAIQLIPFLELFHHSIRGNGIPYQEATIWSLAPKDILLFFLPDAYGYFLDMKKYWVSQCWFKTLYTGGLPFVLSLIFFIAPHPHLSSFGGRIKEFGKERKLFFVLMLFSIFLSLGRYNPLYPFVFKYIPFFNGIRYPAKFLYIFILVLSITAGLGFQRLIELSKECEMKRFKKLFIIFSLTCGFLLLFLVLGHKEIEHFLGLRGFDFPQFNHLSVNLFHAKRFFFYLALVFLLIRIGVEVKWKGWAKILLILFMTADLFGNIGYYGKEKTSDYFQKTKILETIYSDDGHFRIFTTEKTTSMDTPILIDDASPLHYLKEKHFPSMDLLYRLHDIWGIDVIRLKKMDDLYKAFIGSFSISATNLVNLYGVKYIISVTPLEKNHQFELIYARIEGLQGKKEDLLKENTIKLYKNRKPILRGWLVKDFKVMDSEAMLSRLTSKDFHPESEVLFEEEPRFNPPHSPLEKVSDAPKPAFAETVRAGRPLWRRCGGEGMEKAVEIISESNNRIQLLVKAPENIFLILNDTYFPGWQAYVDGKKTKIYKADYTFRAIPLSTGTHRIEFVYDPMSFKFGAAVTLLGILGCICLGWIARRKRKD